MKIECNLEKIKTAISQAERITGKNLTLPVLASVLLVASGKSLKLRAINLSLGIEIEIPAKIEKEGVVAIPGSVLNNVFSNLSGSENVYLEESGGNLNLKTKKNNIKLKGVPYEDFPTIPKVSGEDFEIEPKKIIEGIKSVFWSASPSDIKPEISSVYIYPKENNLVFVSTDSFRLAERKVKIKNQVDFPGIIIPYKNIPEIIRVLESVGGSVLFSFNKNQIAFSGENIYLTSRVIDGVFPDYRQIIPNTFSTEVVLLKQDLLNALKVSNVFSDKFNQISLSIKTKEKLFEFSSSNVDVGENKSDLSASISGEDIELSFNYKYLLDSITSVSTDSLSLKFNGPSKPIVLTLVGDPSFTYLIMPMNR